MSFSREFIYDAIDKVSPVLKRIDENSKRLSKRMSNVGKKMEGIGRKISTRVTAPLTVLGAVSIRNFAKMEYGLDQTHNLVKKGSDAWEKYGAEWAKAQQHGIKMGFTIDDVNSAIFDSPSALGVGKAALNAYTQGMRLAIGGAASLSSALGGVVNIMDAYGTQTTNATDVANTFFNAQVIGKTTVQELAENVGKVAPAAKAAGLSYKELIFGMSALTLGGLKTQQGAIALRNVLSSLTKIAGKPAVMLRRWGVPVGASRIKAAGLVKTIEKLMIATKRHGDRVREALPNVRAFTGVMSFTAENVKKMNDAMKSANNTTDKTNALSVAVKRNMKSAQQQLKMLRGQMTLLSADIGTRLFPILKDLINNVITPVIIKTSTWIKKNPKLAETIIKLAAAFAVLGPVLIVLGSIITTIATLFAVTPIGWIIIGIVAAVAALSAGIYELRKHWKSIIPVIAKFWEYFTYINPIAFFVNIIIKKWRILPKFFTGIFAHIKAAFHSMVATMEKFSPSHIWSELKTHLGFGKDTLHTIRTQERKSVLDKAQIEVGFRPEGAKVTNVMSKTIGGSTLGINAVGI
jgi:TP901 family phage tail tape measure protein